MYDLGHLNAFLLPQFQCVDSVPNHNSGLEISTL